MPAVPMPDAATEATLDAARSEAAGDLKGRFPDSMIAPPPPAQPKVTNSITNSVGQNLANAQPAAPPPAEPGPDAQAVHDYTPQEPSPDAVPVQDDNTMGRALKESAGQLGSEVGNGMMRAAVTTARTLGFAASGVNNLLSEGPADKGTQTRDDAIFNFIKDHVDTAYDHWRTEGDTNAAAQFAGRTAEGVAPMMLGPAAPAVMAGNSATEAGKESIDAGDNTKTAVALATIAGLTTTAQLKVGYKDPNIAKRIAKWVGAGDAIDEAGKATQILVRHLLNNETYQEAVAKVDPLNPTELGVNSLMQAIFGILHTPDGQKLVKKADPDAKPQAPDMSAETPIPLPPPVIPAEGAAPGGQDIPPPPAPTLTPAGPTSPVSTGPLPGAKPVTDKLGPKIPDQPSAEPTADLKAQVADMKDPATPRKAVYLSKDNVANLGPDELKALAGDNIVTKNFDRDGGVLISPNHSERSKATALRKANGDDMQATLGQLTGAGDGKAADQTAVVQGQTPEGAVASETTVAPHEVPALSPTSKPKEKLRSSPRLTPR